MIATGQRVTPGSRSRAGIRTVLEPHAAHILQLFAFRAFDVAITYIHLHEEHAVGLTRWTGIRNHVAWLSVTRAILHHVKLRRYVPKPRIVLHVPKGEQGYAGLLSSKSRMGERQIVQPAVSSACKRTNQALEAVDLIRIHRSSLHLETCTISQIDEMIPRLKTPVLSRLPSTALFHHGRG